MHQCLRKFSKILAHLRLPLQIGYYFSAFTVDKPWMGRVRLQSMVSTLCPFPMYFIPGSSISLVVWP